MQPKLFNACHCSGLRAGLSGALDAWQRNCVMEICIGLPNSNIRRERRIVARGMRVEYEMLVRKFSTEVLKSLCKNRREAR